MIGRTNTGGSTINTHKFLETINLNVLYKNSFSGSWSSSYTYTAAESSTVLIIYGVNSRANYDVMVGPNIVTTGTERFTLLKNYNNTASNRLSARICYKLIHLNQGQSITCSQVSYGTQSNPGLLNHFIYICTSDEIVKLTKEMTSIATSFTPVWTGTNQMVQEVNLNTDYELLLVIGMWYASGLSINKYMSLLGFDGNTISSYSKDKCLLSSSTSLDIALVIGASSVQYKSYEAIGEQWGMIEVIKLA